MRMLALGMALALVGHVVAAPADPYLAKIKAVSKEGGGNQEAGAAFKELVALGPDALLPTLSALDDASPVAGNWLRNAANSIFEKDQQAGKKIAPAPLETFVKDAKHSPVGRRLAYELLVELDAKAPERLLPGMLNDPSGDLRRDAIDVELKKVEPLVKTKPMDAKATYEKLFGVSRDQDQAEKIAKALKELGGKVDLTTHFGVVTEWMIVGPFDSTKGAGFNMAYTPEKGVDLKAKYTGKDNTDVKWQAYKSEDQYGAVNLNKVYVREMDDKKLTYKDCAAYAFTTVEVEKEMPVEIRFGSPCGLKVFLNGKELFAREEYHHGDRFDQYFSTGTMKAGKNELLVKVCQNNQSEPWAQAWQFQLRICDATGGAVPMKIVSTK
jgi:hypothetical protein